MSTQNPITLLDLHGRRLEEAISEVTMFLERIRRTVASSSRGNASARDALYVTIITGSGSHSAQGPVLRSGVQKLLQKRGMDFRLERGGGAFVVDALSGCDLYDPGPATDSKVVLAARDEFHRLSMARTRNNADNFAQATRHDQPRPSSFPSEPHSTPYSRSSSDPMPFQVESNDSDIRTAVQLSIIESQQQRNNQQRLNKEFKQQFQRALSDSEIDNAEGTRNSNEENTEDEESLLKLAYERSIIDAQNEQQQTAKEYEDALLLAIEKSAQDNKASEEDSLILHALAESKALAEAEKANECDDDTLEKIFAESRLEEERRIFREELLMQQTQGKSVGEEEDILDEVIRLSLEEQEEEARAEEDAIKRAIEMSKHIG